ncbi:gamma-glutamyl-gamma-aminobutyrate hydrolase family protein [Streptomonospora nanhaiensis]|uniref:gamma-glutamyl-gamma-aminobutyrate hydrolase family protein n=1 Tax=Streptomonospora nanhaiensis TaxID=1323731 RepID=UPI001C386F64|nr:gamma-glutamyl-gamma-aminobutyrate hydrolase family protein [Streptomonospora nanhaiensis]MBV2364919.1 gamma-glutamyl-gamma-aminobutyrate hydrolase family protein [Streptomonospora nanhaiensis]
MATPVIGISAYAEEARWGREWAMPAVLLPDAYARAVAAAGAVPVVLPPVAGVHAALDRLDGLVLAGGGDVDPARYGAAPHERTGGVLAARDDAELALLEAALAAGTPVLGICRGMQLLNVARGGTLHQHLPDVLGDTAAAAHLERPGVFGDHPVRLDPASRLAALHGATRVTVAAYHHQAVADLGHGLVPAAWADDGTVEALEAPEEPGVLAVQWHPEMRADPVLFRWLAEAAAKRAAERG